MFERRNKYIISERSISISLLPNKMSSTMLTVPTTTEPRTGVGIFASIPPASELAIIRQANMERKEQEKEAKKARTEQEREQVGKLLAEAYKERLEDAVKQAIQALERSTHSCVRLDLNSHEELEAVLPHKIVKTKLHCPHYGGKPKLSPSGQVLWKKRDENSLFVGLFKELQTELEARGYWLLDISDSSKSFDFIVKLYCEKPEWYDSTEPLWHGLNKI